ncbi:MAG TPA: sigma-54 dependent transcriptional regulator [Steroidobacteraceae bacterium]|jgi:two-component system response regulator PilR (NtrC family)|nr:sigma-54 dependent transcriptional regulator [Steroidobacteraceae bacterium]
MPKPAVLVVDDEPDLCELLSITLQRMNLNPSTANTVAAAQRLLKTDRFDLCLTDMQLPDGDGLELVEWMQQYTPDVPVAVITAHGNMETAVRALKVGAFDFVSKPLDLAGLRKLVATAIKLSNTREGDTTVFGPRLLGASTAMHQLREMIARVARSQAPVHISGESGTGKELVAKLIHESGARRDGPFVPVNCGAIPTELMESELFGHKRGSFTGAVSDKKGLIQSAEGGTLFLDEIADLPLHMQVKLLRVIQEKAVRPVGEQFEVGIDVRFLSATHKNLAQLVAEGKFREDLFYRVNVIELRVPSLRERPADVPELAEAILRRLGRRMKITSPVLGKDALSALEAYTFPGNVRELENILERAITLTISGEIRVGDIQLRPSPAAMNSARTADGGATAPTGGALGDHLEDIERDAILKALEQTRYNKTAAAKVLGMSFRALRYRIKKLGIE